MRGGRSPRPGRCGCGPQAGATFLLTTVTCTSEGRVGSWGTVLTSSSLGLWRSAWGPRVRVCRAAQPAPLCSGALRSSRGGGVVQTRGPHTHAPLAVGGAGPGRPHVVATRPCRVPPQAPPHPSTLRRPRGWAVACTVLPTCPTCTSSARSCPSPPRTPWGWRLATHSPVPHSRPTGCSPAGPCEARPSCPTSCSATPCPPSWAPPPR